MISCGPNQKLEGQQSRWRKQGPVTTWEERNSLKQKEIWQGHVHIWIAQPPRGGVPFVPQTFGPICVDLHRELRSGCPGCPKDSPPDRPWNTSEAHGPPHSFMCSSNCKAPCGDFRPRTQQTLQLSANISQTKNVTLKLTSTSLIRGYLGQAKDYIPVLSWVENSFAMSCSLVFVFWGCGLQALYNRSNLCMF